MHAPGAGRSWIRVFVLACVAGLVWGCAEEEYPSSASATSAGDASVSVVQSGPQVCTQARAESLPARLIATSQQASAGSQVVLLSQVYGDFVAACGQCHGPVDSMGGFQIPNADAFTLETIQQNNVLSHVTSNKGCPYPENPSDPSEPMPPCGQANSMAYSKRATTDDVYVFGQLLEEWIKAGGPASFTPSSSAASTDAGADGGTPLTAFAMTPANGDAMTNLGNCIPNAALVGIETSKSAQLDAMFASATSQPGGTPQQALALPTKLSETDLFTLDSETLAQYGVIAYAPGYPLWSDDAGKLRYVRVPRGQSIRFDKATQSFQIPPNTRFYKTFMKQVVDTDGSYRYQKMETRLIVARPDQNDANGNAIAQTALFGTYKWRPDESDADLEQGTLENGAPFPDDILTYDTDAPLAAAILAANPVDPDEALLEAHAIRHYAIPSSQRCVQCHEGSPNQDFILGFTPLQINRRPIGQGGTIAPASGVDELSQLQRLIDYGVITGIDALSDVLPLEQSQGARTPRNDNELIAQGYILGNCAHCHNPRGYPTLLQPLLNAPGTLLDFLPSATVGGIFQFPLERYSPDIFRGALGATPIPFITPSLMDLPQRDANNAPAADVFFGTTASDTSGSGGFTLSYAMFAPWRSLVYRNTQSAFTYEDDLALFPHMPMNTPGFDPRAKQILSDWMVSIPALRKAPDVPEYTYYGGSGIVQGSGTPDATGQPYVEVGAGDPRFAGAQAAAEQRLAILHGTIANPAVGQVLDPYVVYSDPGVTSDILDPDVVNDPSCHPTPTAAPPDDTATHLSAVRFIDHPHWVVTDTTQPSGPYAPRRPDWEKYLAEGATPPTAPSCNASAGDVEAAYQDELDTIALEQSLTLNSAFRTFATTPRPMGLWLPKAGCTYPGQQTVAQVVPAEHWMNYAQGTSPPSPSAPVYMETPGAAVFKAICINCHGKRADSNGFIAQNLTNLTGGLARVADWRDGFFGPSTSPNSNIALVFGPSSLASGASVDWTGVSNDDRAARYMAWMALGGTEVLIPSEILQVVGVTPVLGIDRSQGLTIASANMLAAAKELCASLLGPSGGNANLFSPGSGYLDAPGLNPYLIHSNGDAELWLNLCTFANPSPVHVIKYNSGSPLVIGANVNGTISFDTTSIPPLVSPQAYLSGGAVSGTAVAIGDENGDVISVTPGADGSIPTNWPKWPWCMSFAGSSPSEEQAAIGPPQNYPPCPPSVMALDAQCANNSGCTSLADASRWAVRGAINAGFSVYLYGQTLETMANPPPDYNQCDLLQ